MRGGDWRPSRHCGPSDAGSSESSRPTPKERRDGKRDERKEKADEYPSILSREHHDEGTYRQDDEDGRACTCVLIASIVAA
jgi:hypothetical protein